MDVISEQETRSAVLFVDDEENVLRSLKRLFLDEPYELITALSGREGLAVLKERKVAVIVSDQRMPGMSGSEFLHLARDVQPDAVRIVLTGYADVQAAISAINEGGAYRYIAKPWNDDDFVLVIRDAVATYGLKQENKRLTELTRRQNEELKKWNGQLEAMVQEQTLDIQKKNKDLEVLNEQLRTNFRKTIEVFSGLTELREKTLSSHGKNVATIARRLAGSLQLGDADASNVLVAALLHDVGKIGVPDEVLRKSPSAWTAAELSEYRSHAVRGQVAVDIIEGFHEIGRIIRHHHEHVDGSGFPDGLTRSAIPLGSRIIAVADAFDRMANLGASSAEELQKALDAIEFSLDIRYDRQIFPPLRSLVEERIAALTAERPDRDGEQELLPGRLEPGMALTRDVRSGTGILILARGHVLDRSFIRAIQRYYQLDAPRSGVFVRQTPLYPARA